MISLSEHQAERDRVYNIVRDLVAEKYNTKETRDMLAKKFSELYSYNLDGIVCDETNNPPSALNTGNLIMRVKFEADYQKFYHALSFKVRKKNNKGELIVTKKSKQVQTNITSDLDNFQKELKELINKHSIENFCDMPDFILAEMIVNTIKGVGDTLKKNLDWHGCDSVCHPNKNKKENCCGNCNK